MSSAKAPVIAVVFYSTYGHIGALAESIIEGAKATGAIVKPYAIKETLPEEVLTKMYAGSSLKPKYPIVTPNDLVEADGIIFGFPTRYGRAPAQVSSFFDATGGLWMSGALVGKFAALFTSAGGQHGGHETTALSTLPYFAHQGLVYVPLGYAHPYVNDVAGELHGASPWGVSTVAGGDGSRQPTAGELEVAVFQGKSFASFVGTFVRGKSAQLAETTSTPVAAKAVPAAITESKDGYAVPDGEATKETATTAPVAASAPTTSAPTPAAAATPAKPSAPAAAQTPKKKKGFFASCCGGEGIDK